MTATQINLSERILKQNEIVMQATNGRLIFSSICVGTKFVREQTCFYFLIFGSKT